MENRSFENDSPLWLLLECMLGTKQREDGSICANSNFRSPEMELEISHTVADKRETYNERRCRVLHRSDSKIVPEVVVGATPFLEIKRV